jgi:hypothetical protein
VPFSFRVLKEFYVHGSVVSGTNNLNKNKLDMELEINDEIIKYNWQHNT